MSSPESRRGGRDQTELKSIMDEIKTGLKKCEKMKQLHKDVESDRQTCRVLLSKKEGKVVEGQQPDTTPEQSNDNLLSTPNDNAINPYRGIRRLLASDKAEYKEAGDELLLAEFKAHEAQRAALSRNSPLDAPSSLNTKKTG